MSNIVKNLFLHNHKQNVNIFPTGFKDLDNCIKNIKTGSLITIGGRPAMGKTEFVLSVVNNLLSNNKKVTYFNLDLTQEYFINRLIANKTNLPIKDVFERNFGIIWCFRINSVTLQLQWCDAAAKYGAMYQATMVLCIR